MCDFCCTFAPSNNINMKKIFFLAVVILCSWHAQAQKESYLRYIEQWKSVAIEQQAEYGIPASITMAQALLESAAGQSELATIANNHFGIKCSNGWMGAVYYYDDDSKDECFRQYADAAESFRDHSLFLQRPRYATCFEITVEDYEGWANRLKECGYATDKNYAPKLIKLIEDYRLDTLVAYAEVGEFNPDAQVEAYQMPEKVKEGVAVGEEVKERVSEEVKDAAAVDTLPKEQPKRPLKAVMVRRTDPIMVIHNEPEPELVVPLTARQERDSFLLAHPKKRCNGVNYVLAREGDTYANVAFRLNVRERDLREDNDALGRDLMPGDRIYLAAKKTTGAKDYVMTHPGQSLWKLSQEECVTIEAIQKLNELDPTIRTFRTRQKIYLKKVKDDGIR